MAQDRQTDDRETLPAEVPHEVDEVCGDGALGLLRVVGAQRRGGGPAVAAHVGADHGEPALDEPGRDPVPGRGGAGVTVDEKDGRTAAAMAHPQGHLAQVDPFIGEPLEHDLSLPAPDPFARADGDEVVRDDLQVSRR